MYLQKTFIQTNIRFKVTVLTCICLQGYAQISISPNDYWSGWVGFYAANSSTVYADEDGAKPAELTIERKNASFGVLEVRLTCIVDLGWKCDEWDKRRE